MAAIKAANSLNVDDVMKGFEKLEFSTLMGQVKMIKRPDLGINRYFSGISPLDMGYIKNGELVWDSQLQADDLLQCLETVLGHKGEW